MRSTHGGSVTEVHRDLSSLTAQVPCLNICREQLPTPEPPSWCRFDGPTLMEYLARIRRYNAEIDRNLLMLPRIHSGENLSGPTLIVKIPVRYHHLVSDTVPRSQALDRESFIPRLLMPALICITLSCIITDTLFGVKPSNGCPMEVENWRIPVKYQRTTMPQTRGEGNGFPRPQVPCPGLELQCGEPGPYPART
jgi:hypothetical protein